MNVEHLDVKAINQRFVEKVFGEGGNPDSIKEAQEQITTFIRTYFRENGILRRAIEPVYVSESSIDRLLDTDNPAIILDIQPDSVAYSVPFDAKGKHKRFEGSRAAAEFTKLTTDEYSFNKQRILTYTYPVDQQLMEQGIKDLMKAEDEVFIDLVEKVATDNSRTANLSGVTGGINEIIKAGRQAFRANRPANRQVPITTVICNENTYDRFLSLPASVYATQFNESILTGGPNAVEKPFGLNWVVTNKTDLVPDNKMYFLSSPEYIGGFFLLQDATTYMKTEADVLKMTTYEYPAIAVINDALLVATI